jgi:ACS family hexuronate transporter-like MFS transporter
MNNKMTNYRWTVVSLLFFATTINYLDRNVIGILKPTLEQVFGWNEKDYSKIVMAFTASYAAGMFVFGRIIDKIGSKLGYTIIIIVWSIAAILHAGVRSTLGFIGVRSLLGLGESGNFPAAVKAVAEWFPKKERALATGIFNSGANIGAMIVPIVVPLLLSLYGWQMAFVVTGAVGFIWLIFWVLLYQVPSKHKKVNQAELDHIASDQINAAEPIFSSEPPISWGKLFTLKQTWVFIVGKFMTDPVWYFFLFWLPSYFSTTYNLSLSKPSIPLVVVYTMTTIGSIGGGWLSSWMIKKGYPIFKARKITLLIVGILVFPIFLVKFAFISVAAAAHQAWSANIYSVATDMFKNKDVSSVIGIGGMAGSVGGILFPLLIGEILEKAKLAGDITVGYNLIFAICSVAYLTAWLIIHLINKKLTPVNM